MDELHRQSADEQLMNGFAAHVRAWATLFGATPEMQKILSRIARDLSAATLDGHVCLDLNDHEAIDVLADTRAMLLASGLVGTPNTPGSQPLILDDENRLYLHRYYDYEKRLAQCLKARQVPMPQADPASLRLHLDAFFGEPEKNERTDWPRIAAALAMQGKLLVISGGPGTGKTTTIVNLLACLLEDNPACRVALTAPTGKAAARMLETIRERATSLPEAIQKRLPKDSFTIHRLLAITPEKRFLHHANNPLPFDAIVVDEASMLDLALATQLFEAIPRHARVILLGDKDQLSAVEAGAVFSALSTDSSLTDTCIERLMQSTGLPRVRIAPPPAKTHSGLLDSVIWFTENFRFSSISPIGQLAQAVSQGEANAALALLGMAGDVSLQWFQDQNGRLSETALTSMREGYATYLETLRTHPCDLSAIFDAFERFRILCAMREGPRGVNTINSEMERYFRKQLGKAVYAGEQWYAGRPIMVLRNDYVLNVFNGDIGIALFEEGREDKPLKVYFPDQTKGFRAIDPSRLPEHETAFAMTVHKSQGSEFDSIMVIMPDAPNRIATRELLYTAITRARKQVGIYANENVLRSAINAPTRRNSGLHSRIRAASTAS